MISSLTSCHKKPAGSLHVHQFINPNIQGEGNFFIPFQIRHPKKKRVKETGVPSPALDVVQVINLGIGSCSAASFSLSHFKALGSSLLQSLRDECHYLWNSEAVIILYNLVVAKWFILWPMLSKLGLNWAFAILRIYQP